MTPNQYQHAPAPQAAPNGYGYPAPQGYQQAPQAPQAPHAPAYGHQPPQGFAPPPAGGAFFNPAAPRGPIDPAAGGFFRGVEHAQTVKNANYIKPGHYWMRIDKCKMDVARDRIPFWAAEMTVVRVFDNAQGLGHSLGEAATRLVKQSNDYFLPEAKAFVAGVLGMQPEQITEQNCNEIFGPSQPLNGTIVEVKAWGITSQRTGKAVTRVTWVREVPAAEALATLPPQSKEAFFPGGALERLAALEAQQRPVQQIPAAPTTPAPQAPTAAPQGYQPAPTPPQGYHQPQQPAAPAYAPPQAPPGNYPPPVHPQPGYAPQGYPQPQQPPAPGYGPR